jgi:zinc transport system ATP-binding protein
MPEGAGARDVLVAARDVDVRFGRKEALSRVSIVVRQAEIVSLIGPNGSGKTTLVRVILGLLKPAGGSVTRRPGLTVGYVPQRLAVEPTLPLTVGDFLDLGAPAGDADWGRRRASLLDEVGADAVADEQLDDISGGELRRVMLARALARNPHLLVLDEPVQGVDVGGQADLYRLIKRIRDEHGCGVLLVSHELHLVMAATDVVVCLNRHVCCAGRPEAVSREPGFIQLFGPQVASAMAVYHHAHDHRHDRHGHAVPFVAEGPRVDG